MHIKKLLPFLISAGLLFTGVASAWYLPPSIKKGDLIVATSTTQTVRLATSTKGSLLNMGIQGFTPAWFNVGSDGMCLKASSTASSGLAWDSCATGGTGLSNLNGMTGATQSFATSTTGGLQLNITSATDIHTFALQPSTGYNIPLTASTTNWNGFWDVPSTRITAGTNLVWSGNTLNGTMASSTIIAVGTATHSPSITFATSTADANIKLGIVCGTATCTFTPSFSSQLSVARGGSNASSFNANKILMTDGAGTTFTEATAGTQYIAGGVGTAGFNTYFTGSGVLGTGKLIDNGTVLGMNATSSTIGFNIQGTAGSNDIFNVASSTGASVFKILPTGVASATTLTLLNPLGVAYGGTATSTAPVDNSLFVGNGSTFYQSVLPSCSNPTTSKLLYNNSTRAFTCGTDVSGSGGGSTTTITSNLLVNGPNFTFATGSATGLNLNISGNDGTATLTFTPQLQTGYGIPLTASTTEWSNFYTTPSTRITDGTALTWAGNTLNVDDLFPTYAYGTNTYATILSYPTYSYASSTFPSFSYATNTFATILSYPTYTYASSSYATLWNLKAGSNITITTSTGVSLAVSSAPTFTSIATTNASTTNLTVSGNSYIGTILSGSWNGTAIDIGSYTNLAAGRSLTLSGDSVEADGELYTHKKTIVLTASSGTITATTTVAEFELPVAATITEVSCSTDTGSATIQLDERARATPNTSGTDVMSSTLACDNNAETTTTFANAGIAADVPVNIDIDSVASSPTRVRIHIKYTNDD